ncbi:7018_t:CDS:2 [Dentiscutata erythropus]|uniref:7018_t:CDS:1 n=1 Tax=Dentiscutata erythropus TaxID=1348616 RepID=A0A9N9JA92_9GLOM|nr:7018_t:CDS:2 [Dentiscutata erythropus]
MEWIKTTTKRFNSTDTNRIIILEDFNSVNDPTIDRSATSKYRPNKTEADTLIDADIIDTEEEIATDHHCARAILLDTFRKSLPSNIYKQKTQYRYNLNTAQKEN